MPILLSIILADGLNSNTASIKRISPGRQLCLTAHFLIQITGIKYTTATNTGWIISMIPLIVAVLAFLFLKEKLGKTIILGIILATIGVLFLISKGKISDLKWLSSYGDWLVLISAHTWAVYTILTRNASRSLDPLLVTFTVLLPSTILSLAIMTFSSDWSKLFHLPLDAVVSLLMLGLLGTCIGAVAVAGWCRQNRGRRGQYLSIHRTAGYTAVAVPYLHESFGLFTAIGGGLVLFGVWIAGRQKK